MNSIGTMTKVFINGDKVFFSKMSKGKKMQLGDFLQQDSWADDMTDLLPTAPEKETVRVEKRDFNRPSLPIPNHPPFNAFIGNLAFTVTDRDVEVFLGDLAIKSIRLITDHEQQPKGFGYVEFEDRESLMAALKMSGESLLNRSVRISVADGILI
jgi:translation initiation factor 4B